MSYNPSLDDHQALLNEVVQREKKIIKEKNHLKRVTTQMFSKVTPEQRDTRRLEEMCSGLDDESEGEANDDTEDGVYRNINPPVENKRKSKQSRRKELQQKELQKKQAGKKALKKQIADLNRYN